MRAFAAERGVRHRNDYPNTVMRRIPRRIGSFMLLGSALVLSGCPQVADVWVLPTSTDARLAFGIGNASDHAKPVSVVGFAVTTCAERRLTLANPGTRFNHEETRIWEIEHVSGTDSIAWLSYGEVPPNYRVITPPTPLTSGDCYTAGFSGRNGGGRVYFRITDDHRVIEVSGPDA